MTTALTPGWTGTRTYNESLLMVSTGGADPIAQTLFAATSIVAVTDYTQSITYTAGTDYTYNSGTRTLTAPPGSRLASVLSTTLLPAGSPLLDESHWWQTQQVCITYDHAAGGWTGPTTTTTAKLTATMGKLNGGTPLKLGALGDSITAGASASAYAESFVSPQLVQPFLPRWTDLVATALNTKYGSVITQNNAAVGGKDSAWGATNVHGLISVYTPDLVILAFGMNDQSAGVLAATLVANLNTMIADVRASNGAAEFIILAPMSPNPAWGGANAVRTTYLAALQTLVTGLAYAELVDMTTVHNTLIAAKKYTDMTGNGVNHPNDWLIRWHAQQIGGLLGLP